MKSQRCIFVKFENSQLLPDVLLFGWFWLQVVFEAARGSGNQGDIAIDDPKMFTGSCPKRGKIKVEKESNI